MTTPTAFAQPDAEHDVIGACLVSRSAVETVARQLVASDFASVHAGLAFSAIQTLHGAGIPVDVATVADQLRRQGAAWSDVDADLIAWCADVPSSAAAGRYAEIITDAAARRSLHHLAAELRERAQDPTATPTDIAGEVRTRLADIGSPAVGSPGDRDIADFINDEDTASVPVIPSLLAEDDRVVIVAPEGVGKSELSRQLVVCAAYGIQPFTGAPMPAVPTLLVDLENPRGLVRERLGSLVNTAESRGTRAPATLWHRPGGIDLRKRADRLAFEDVLRRNRPHLVSLGPVYKSYVRNARETDEQVASEVQAILDDLRTRYSFALSLEHHTPQASAGVRELRPFGSSLWLRWPEYGIRLTPSKDRPGALVVGRWRGDRSEAAWPDELHRGDVFPWVGYWRNGAPDRGGF